VNFGLNMPNDIYHNRRTHDRFFIFRIFIINQIALLIKNFPGLISLVLHQDNR